jgi:hypothetical protein
MERLINAAVMIVAMIIPTLGAQGFEKTCMLYSSPGWPLPDGPEKGNIATLLQRYDSLEIVSNLLLARQTLLRETAAYALSSGDQSCPRYRQSQDCPVGRTPVSPTLKLQTQSRRDG